MATHRQGEDGLDYAVLSVKAYDTLVNRIAATTNAPKGVVVNAMAPYLGRGGCRVKDVPLTKTQETRAV